jgi:AraC-like DNA-binding protein
MPEKEYADIIPLLKKMCLALQLYADTRHITLNLVNTEETIPLFLPFNDLISHFSKIISAIIDYVPDYNSITLTVALIEENGLESVSIKVHNTGINLKMVAALINKSHLPFTLYSSAANETTFEVGYPLLPRKIPVEAKKESENGTLLNYTRFVNGIKSHFARLSNPVAPLAETKPKEAVFLTNINNCIIKNLDNDQFDANALSTAMCMCRAQLLRRLKLLTGNSPAYYIKTMRLEKAKKLLETTDVSISETAFMTGFNSSSHFTKVFVEKYGLTPSQFVRSRRNATNEQEFATNVTATRLKMEIPL